MLMQTGQVLRPRVSAAALEGPQRSLRVQCFLADRDWCASGRRLFPNAHWALFHHTALKSSNRWGRNAGAPFGLKQCWVATSAVLEAMNTELCWKATATPYSSTGGLRVKLEWEKSALSSARMSKLYRLPDHDYPKLRELLMAEMKKKQIEKVRANAVRARSIGNSTGDSRSTNPADLGSVAASADEARRQPALGSTSAWPLRGQLRHDGSNGASHRCFSIRCMSGGS